MDILYEDNHTIVVIKPENIPTQADSSGDFDMLSCVRDYIKVKYEKPGNVYVGLVHRLDRPVSGIMVFAKTSKAASRLTDEFAKKSAKKKYVAVVEGEIQRCGTLSCYMRKNEKTFSAELCDKNDSGAKSASLFFRRIAYKDGYSLVDIDLFSGRHHQIRFQLANEGYPIYGDCRYNKKFIDKSGVSIALFAYSLSFSHPTTHETMYFSHKPTQKAFSMFDEELSVLCENATPAYIDNDMIVLDKPYGICVAKADDPEHETLEDRILRAFPTARPVHRLDATTCGLVFFARNDTAFSILSEAFSRKGDTSIEKLYRCNVIGKPEQRNGVLRLYLEKNAANGLVTVYDHETKNAKYAETEYRLCATKTCGEYEISTLEVRLITGRTHQIRASLAHIGLPIVGDDKYGNRNANRALKKQVPELISYKAVLHKGDSSQLSCRDNTEIVSFYSLS